MEENKNNQKKTLDLKEIAKNYGYKVEELLENVRLTDINLKHITLINGLIMNLLYLEREAAKGKAVSIKFDYDADQHLALFQYSIK